MPQRRSNLPIFLGLGLSLALHAMVLTPMFMASLNSERGMSLAQARFEPEQLEEANPPQTSPPEETPLGLDADTPSSFTWVGYQEYERHIAALADTDQAAFTDSPNAAAPRVVPVDPTPTAEPLDPDATDEEQIDPAEVDEERDPDNTDEDAAPAVTPQPSPLEPDQLMRLQAFSDALRFLMPPPRRKEQITVAASPTATPTEQPPATPATPLVLDSEPQPESSPTLADPKPGDPADKESDSTSVIDAPVENWKQGKPLAAPGLDIKTRKPDFTILQRLSGVAKNPLYRISFGRDTKPTHVKTIESSGNQQIDEAIKASLYRWRAEGSRLDKLTGDQTADVTIRIVMVSN